MSDISDTLKSILDSGAGDALKNVVGSLSQESGGISTNSDSIASLMQLKGIAESLTANRSDPRANLLMSLKPYMREGRRESIDSMVRLIGIMNIIRLMGNK